MAPNKILVVGPNWIGDMVMATALCHDLKTQWPDVHITVLAPKWTLSVAAHSPAIDACLEMPFRHRQWAWGARRAFAKSLHAQQFDQAFVLPNSFKSAFIPYWAKIPVRVGYWGECRWRVLTHPRRCLKQKYPKLIDRYRALLAPPLGQAVTTLTPPPLATLSQEKQAILNQGKYVVCVPGAAYGPAKQWPMAYYATLAKSAMAAGWQVIVLGSEADQVLGAQMLLEAPGIQAWCGQTTLEQAMAVLGHASHVLSNDSGLMHVAAAMGRSQTAFYGSSDPGYTPPNNTQAVIARHPLPCQPCFKRTCPLGHTHCLTQLTPESLGITFPWQA